jgi:hypothetical protein
MALSVNRPLDTKILSGIHMADVTTGTPSAFVTCPMRGQITGFRSALYGALSGSSTVITLKVNGTAVAGATLTMAAGGAAGDCDEGTPTPGTTTAYVEAGDSIEFASDGGSNNGTVPATFLVEISNRRR